MKAKKVLAVLLSAGMCLTMLFGCGGNDAKDDQKEPDTKQEETQKEDDKKDAASQITDGYYMYAYNVGDMVMTNYFHFYEEQPVLGKVFYAGFAMNQINMAGTYEVEEAEYNYSCYKDRAAVENEEDPVSGTAPYTVTFYDFNGNEIGKCGFDGDVLYNDCEALSAVSAGANMYLHDTDGEESKYVETYEAEVGQVYLSYVSESDETCTVALNHNGRYVDMMDMMVEGSWEMKETADGYELTLTPDMDGDTAAVVATSKDQMTATYTPDGGEAVNLICTSKELKAVATFTGEGPEVMEGTVAEVKAELFEDGTMKVSIGIPGASLDVDAGTWEAAGSDYKLTLDGVGEITTAGGKFQYTNPDSQPFALDAELTLAAE